MKTPPVKLIEDHDEAYFFWKKLGLKGKTLVHLDAHIDFGFHAAKPTTQTFAEAKSKEGLIRQLSTNLMYKELKVKERALTNIGNYIYPAMRDGIVTDFYWVIPGDRREFEKSAKNLRNMMNSCIRQDPFETKEIVEEKGALRGRVYGRNFIFTTLEDLPENITDALLDIDTDYLAIDTIRKAGASRDAGERFPWIWPEALVECLKEKRLRPSCVTVAYSVNGGFTPLIYKFLGDEVAAFFTGSVTDELKDIISEKKEALNLFKEGKAERAIAFLQGIERHLENVNADTRFKDKLKAHIAFLLFRCFVMLDNFRKAKSCYRKAILSDKTYRVRDNSYGPMHLREKNGLKKAELEFKAVLASDGSNTHALAGLGNVFMRKREFKKAKTLFKKACLTDKKNREAILGLSRAELSLKNYARALRYLENYKPVGAIHGSTHSLKAGAFQGLGKFDEALKEYKLAHRFGVDPALYLGLFKLLSKKGIPQEHKEWITSRVETYRNYRKNFPETKRNRETVKLLNRIDRVLKRVK